MDILRYVLLAVASTTRVADAGERMLVFGGADLEGRARHAVDDGACLILRDGAGAGLAHVEQALRAVAAHAGEDARPRPCAPARARHRREQHVDRGAVAVDGLARLQRRR